MPARKTNQEKELLKPIPDYLLKSKRISDFRVKIAQPLVDRLFARRGDRREQHKIEIMNMYTNHYQRDQWTSDKIKDLQAKLKRN